MNQGSSDAPGMESQMSEANPLVVAIEFVVESKHHLD